jgi:plasmid stability protein
MSELLLRDVDDALVSALARQAARHGRSVEAEHRLILAESLLSEQPKKRSFKEVLASMPYFEDDDLFDVR